MQSTAQGHLRAFHEIKSYTSWIQYKTCTLHKHVKHTNIIQKLVPSILLLYKTCDMHKHNTGYHQSLKDLAYKTVSEAMSTDKFLQYTASGLTWYQNMDSHFQWEHKKGETQVSPHLLDLNTHPFDSLSERQIHEPVYNNRIWVFIY